MCRAFKGKIIIIYKSREWQQLIVRVFCYDTLIFSICKSFNLEMNWSENNKDDLIERWGSEPCLYEVFFSGYSSQNKDYNNNESSSIKTSSIKPKFDILRSFYGPHQAQHSLIYGKFGTDFLQCKHRSGLHADSAPKFGTSYGFPSRQNPHV